MCMRSSGPTFASMVVTFPTVLAHLLGQLLYYMGADHIVFGSDSPWYGGRSGRSRRCGGSRSPKRSVSGGIIRSSPSGTSGSSWA